MMQLWIEPLAILAILVLLAASVYMLLNMYVCDNFNCKAFTDADEVAPRGSKEYTIALLNNLYNDGIWALPYIGAVVAAVLILWFIGVPVTVKTFAIVFLVSFIVMYFLFSFFGHHYIKFIANYVADYIEEDCPGVTDAVCAKEADGDLETMDVTFAPPVITF